MRRLLRVLATLQISQQRKTREVHARAARRQLRQVADGRRSPDPIRRDLKLSELHRKERPRARKQRVLRVSGHEVAKPRLHRNDHRNKQFGLKVSLNTTAKRGLRCSAFYGGCIGGKVFRAQKPRDTRSEDNCGHKQKRHMHVRVSANVAEQPERLYIAECMDDKDACGKRCRTHRRQRNIRQSGV